MNTREIAKTVGLLQEISLLSVIIRLALSVLIGGIIGTERGLRNRPAGFMTYVLVCLGSTLIMLTNQYISSIIPGTDPTRLGAQVVSGIGFLGAGTIIVTRKDEIRGLTTAAGLWVAAGLGLAVGVGFYAGSIVGCLFIVFVLVSLKRIDIYIKQHAKSMEIYLEYDSSFSIRTLSEFVEKQGFELFDIQRGNVKSLKKELGTLIFSLGLLKRTNHQDVLKSLYTIEGVEYVRELS
ncbi:MgtC/SapB family protein [Faecalicatena acetigenes]|uniref:MgtC/SapB family protein n=1 Tax=Faecalicatena acetigenes TaxID=2981790 RepID=A0ABT2TE55_9FIRM|nr:MULTISPECIES: MgtC/SapB family protein [Lachnospiraceae]MCU6748092.1 MgtC/SapB family protein [Faecalicatena acetigenes]SCI26024.1 putative Mg(2+) transport ATPase [uncultured Clostridium sp.]